MTQPRPSIETVRHDLGIRLLRVTESERIGPRMQRVVLDGEDLDGTFPFPARAATDHVKLVFPDPSTGVVALPLREPDGSGLRLRELANPVRDYTVRRLDHRGLTIDFVLHAHGPAGRWAQTALPGMPLGVLGPRGSHLYPTGYDRYVLIGDETALPAVGRWLDATAWTAPMEVHVLAAGTDEYPLPDRTRTDVVWHVSPDPTARAEAVTALATELSLTDDTFVWAAGEADSLVPLRRTLRERGLARAQYDIDGYWRTGVVNLDHHAVSDDD